MRQSSAASYEEGTCCPWEGRALLLLTRKGLAALGRKEPCCSNGVKFLHSIKQVIKWKQIEYYRKALAAPD
jgi:hypothetical protein